MKRNLLLLLLLLISTTACVGVSGKHTTKLNLKRSDVLVDGAPRIRLEIVDRSDKPEKAMKTLQGAQRKFDFLQAAGENVENPDYTLRLSIDRQAWESDINYLSGASFLLIPAFFHREVNVSATLADAGGRELETFSSTGHTKMVSQLHLLWVAPLTLPWLPHRHNKMWKNAYRDVFIQAGMAIAEDQASGGARSSSRVAEVREPSR